MENVQCPDQTDFPDFIHCFLLHDSQEFKKHIDPQISMAPVHLVSKVTSRQPSMFLLQSQHFEVFLIIYTCPNIYRFNNIILYQKYQKFERCDEYFIMNRIHEVANEQFQMWEQACLFASSLPPNVVSF